MAPPLVLHLEGRGLRLTVGDDGAVHGWVDLMLPQGNCAVVLSVEDDTVVGFELLGPRTRGELLDCSTTVDIPSGGVFCFTDSRHYQGTLGPLLSHNFVATELGGSHARVVTPNWLGTQALLVGPATSADQNLWALDWRCGGGADSLVSFTAMEG